MHRQGSQGVDMFLVQWYVIVLEHPCLHGVENPIVVAVHFQERIDVSPLWSYPPPLIPTFPAFGRVS